MNVQVYPSLLCCVAIGLAALTTGCSARREAAPTSGRFAYAEKIYVPDVSDFGKVNEFLYRGGQPKGEGVLELKKFGIDTIVDLRGELHGLVQNEKDRAEALGMRVLLNDPPRQRAESLTHFVPLDRVFAEADFITLHVPLTARLLHVAHLLVHVRCGQRRGG